MGLIRFFVRNPVAANMLMVLILGGGLVASFVIPRELFPEFELDMVSVSVPYPGAAPEDIERGIALRVEEYVTGLEGVKEVTSTSREGLGSVMLELQASADAGEVLDEVKSEVDKIDFPDEAEDPVVREVTFRRQVIQVAVYGDVSERTLKEVAEDIKEDLTNLPEISQVSVTGVREYEISVEVDEETLRRLGITLGEVAIAIRQSSFDLPAGRIKTRSGDLSVRVVGQKYTPEEYGRIPVRSLEDGTVVRLRDIANVREVFEDVDIGGQFNGQPAVLVAVFKTGDEDVVEISRAVREYVQEKQAELPTGLSLSTWGDLSKVVSDRLDMLVRNGLQGLVLVILVLWFFLGWRLAFWVALGIPVSILGTIIVMDLSGATLNMMSMFALIMALGLIVDDAIVVGENVYSRYQDGESPVDAAINGSGEVEFPVLGAVMTTWLAFVPLFFIPGIMGKFIRQLPGVVILTLFFSLVECLTILPSHLAHSLQHRLAHRGETPGLARRFRMGIDRGIAWFINRPFTGLFRLATRHRYVTLLVVLGVIAVMFGAFVGGHIRQTIFPDVESDTIKFSLIMPTGTPLEKTSQVARRVAKAALQLNDQIQTETGDPLVQDVYTLLGQQTGGMGGGDSGGHVAEVIVELLPGEQRGKDLSTLSIRRQWRANVGAVPEALTARFEAFRGGPGGKMLEFRVLARSTDQAKRIAEKLKDRLRTFSGVSDLEDDALPGKMEAKIRPTRKAYTLGITPRELAEQLRDAYYGNESIEIQRGRDEIKVMVRYPEDLRTSVSSLENKRIRTARGDEIPFYEVASIEQGRGYTTLRRVNGKSVVTVSGDVDDRVANAEQIIQELQRDGVFKELTAGIDGASIDLRGQRQQRAESLGALKIWFPLALLFIYAILAVIFRSYTQPIIVMVAIPFGLVGAVVGHWIVGFDITLLSMFGMVALAGIVVNDSLVLIDRVNREIRDGATPAEAVEVGSRRRFRAIFLTTITTVAGMTPLLMERSFQAQFLKPMAVSITFGLTFATLLTLLVVPCMFLIGQDILRGLRWVWTGSSESQPGNIPNSHPTEETS